MRQRITGLDLNGRFDVAARDWSPEDPAVTVDPPLVVEGGVAASVVTTLDGRRIAGPQATVAPHGRGEGWGRIGVADRRRALSAAVDRYGQDEGDAADLRAAVEALARGAAEVILTVPDLPAFGEAAQGTVIRSASGPRRRVRLLWRPVAAFLDLLGTGAIPQGSVNSRYRLLVHGSAGIEEQILTLREDPERKGHHAPQRDGPGQLFAAGVGLDILFARAAERVRDTNPQIDWRRCETSRLGPQVLTGASQPGETEVLRFQNATWVEARAPAIEPDDLDLEAARVPPPERPIAATFLITPLATPLADALSRALAQDSDIVRVVRTEAIARGALRAGRLIERGLPHYYDRLEPIAIAVLRHDRPDFEGLIDENAVVPANREYVSPELEGFVWGRGKTDAEFYVLKGASEVRHWEVTHEEAPSRDRPVTLRLRQTPGQSWARLSVTSHGWEALQRSPIDLDWEALTPLAETPEEVLAKLRTPPPTFPDLLVEHAHLDLWRGGDWAGEGAIRHLSALGRPAAARDWSTLLRRYRREPVTRERFWLVGTDGGLPEGLDPTVAAALDQALAEFAQRLLASTPRRPLPDNECTLALTWCYKRCPEEVQDRLVAALEAHLAEAPDAILLPRRAVSVVTQGAGRAVSGTHRLARVLHVLARRRPNNDTINALAMILTRRAEAPEALSRELVDGLLGTLGRELHAEVSARRFKLKFRNTLSALAGLFRWRVREPYALLADREPVAAALRDTLASAEALLDTPAYRNVRLIEQKIAQIHKIIEHLDGRGDPDILRFIEQDDDDDRE